MITRELYVSFYNEFVVFDGDIDGVESIEFFHNTTESVLAFPYEMEAQGAFFVVLKFYLGIVGNGDFREYFFKRNVVEDAVCGRDFCIVFRWSGLFFRSVNYILFGADAMKTMPINTAAILRNTGNNTTFACLG